MNKYSSLAEQRYLRVLVYMINFNSLKKTKKIAARIKAFAFASLNKI